LNFDTPQQHKLEKVTVAEAERYLAEGHFPAGSMAPKVRAASQFVKQGGEKAIITSVTSITSSLKNNIGTVFVD